MGWRGGGWGKSGFIHPPPYGGQNVLHGVIPPSNVSPCGDK